MAANRGTIESVCAELVGTPDPQTIRGYFNEQVCVEELLELEKELNAALAAEVPRQVHHHAASVSVPILHVTSWYDIFAANLVTSGLEQSAVPQGPFLHSPRCHRT